MSEKLEHISIRISGYKAGVDDCVFYKKLETPSDSQLGIAVNTALHDKKCDFINIRRVAQ